MNLQTFLIHFQRVRHQLGEPLSLRSKKYRLRGYCANRLAANEHHEPHMTPIFELALRGRTGAFLDVGTNVGQTFTKVLAMDPGRRYIGFDPQLACCFFLDRFIRDNNLQNASVMPIALSEENKILALYSSGDYDEMASIDSVIDSMGGKRSKVTYVAARVGDEVLEEMGITDVAAIKVDVEGAELQVFKGFKRTLQTSKPVLVFEVLPNFHGHERHMLSPELCRTHNDRAAALYAFLSSIGYQINQITDAGTYSPIERFDLDTPSRFIGSDYIAFSR
jgi:FkbM family methyltransferase